jgi:hypothetical protein
MRLAISVSLIFQAYVSLNQCIAAASAIYAHHHDAPRVDLGYATYEGTGRSSGINEFLGMRFARLMALFE